MVKRLTIEAIVKAAKAASSIKPVYPNDYYQAFVGHRAIIDLIMMCKRPLATKLFKQCSLPTKQTIRSLLKYKRYRSTKLYRTFGIATKRPPIFPCI